MFHSMHTLDLALKSKVSGQHQATPSLIMSPESPLLSASLLGVADDDSDFSSSFSSSSFSSPSLPSPSISSFFLFHFLLIFLFFFLPSPSSASSFIYFPFSFFLNYILASPENTCLNKPCTHLISFNFLVSQSHHLD